MYKWQVFLGGVASATILVAGAAAPALAQTSPLTSVAESVTGSQVTADACMLAGVPMAAQVNSAVAGVTGQSCTTSQDPSQHNENSASSSTMTSALPGLSTVTGEIPGLSSMSSSLPGLTSLTGQVSKNSGLTTKSTARTTPLQAANTSSKNSLGSAQSSQNSQASSVLSGALSGVTGALPASSLTGGLPGLSSLTGTLSGVTGSQG